MTWTLTVLGAPRTKKTSNVLARAGARRVVLPSAAWRKWAKSAVVLIWSPGCPVTVPVNCAAVFYRDADRGDAVGYYQGLADLLEARGVVANDRLLVSWDGSRLAVDRARPRVEIVLTVAEAP